MIPVLLARGNSSINDFIASVTSSNRGKSGLVSLSLARAISDKLELPNGPVDAIEIYFAGTYKNDILNKLVHINETFCIDKEKTLEYTLKLYTYRYYQTRTDNPVLCICEGTAVEDFFGITRVLGEDIIALIKEHKDMITKYVFRFSEILEKLD